VPNRGEPLDRPTMPVRGASFAETALFTASLGSMQGGRLLYAFALASKLNPAEFTAWSLVMASLAYLPLLTLGLINGLGRSLPYLAGAGDSEEERTSVGTSWFVVLGLAAIGLVVAVWVALALGTYKPVLILAVLATWAVFQLQQVILRSYLKFIAASYQQLTIGFLSIAAAVVVFLGPLQGFEQAVLAYALAVVGAIVVGTAAHSPVFALPSARVFVRLVAVGWPIAAAGVLFGVLISADRWIATALIGARGAAPYVLAATLASGLMLLPNAISQQTYPRMARIYGATKDFHEVLRLAKSQNRVAGLGTFLLVVPASILASAAILVLPSEYREGIPVLIVLSASLVCLAQSTGYGNALNTLGRQWVYLSAQAGALFAGVSAMAILGTLLGVSGVALGVAVGYAAFALFVRLPFRRMAGHPRVEPDSAPPQPKESGVCEAADVVRPQ